MIENIKLDKIYKYTQYTDLRNWKSSPNRINSKKTMIIIKLYILKKKKKKNFASWETCVQVRKQQLKLDMKQWTGSKIGKGVHQGCILSPCLFNFYADYIMWNDKLDESQAGIKIARRNITNLRYVDVTTLTTESKEPLNEGERGEWKS